MKSKNQVRRRGCGGFTLTEVLIASAVSLTVLAVTVGVYVNIIKSWHGIDLRMQADRDVNIALSRLAYGMDDRRGIRAAHDVTFTSNSVGWTVSYTTGVTTPQSNSITYSATAKTLVFNPGAKTLGKNISSAVVDEQPHSLVVTLRVDLRDGTLQVQRTIGTEIFWRN
jgi:prepilin-type N-terminal cleavage/methylation domain-containing protein